MRAEADHPTAQLTSVGVLAVPCREPAMETCSVKWPNTGPAECWGMTLDGWSVTGGSDPRYGSEQLHGLPDMG